MLKQLLLLKRESRWWIFMESRWRDERKIQFKCWLLELVRREFRFITWFSNSVFSSTNEWFIFRIGALLVDETIRSAAARYRRSKAYRTRVIHRRACRYSMFYGFRLRSPQTIRIQITLERTRAPRRAYSVSDRRGSPCPDESRKLNRKRIIIYNDTVTHAKVVSYSCEREDYYFQSHLWSTPQLHRFIIPFLDGSRESLDTGKPRTLWLFGHKSSCTFYHCGLPEKRMRIVYADRIL